ncbi:hypothetical protein E2562_033451 [Oryza meyeriana var. granulata]|uniref:Uncharacterized protein n=1 Tax=Oryza meyeriana var. granulata TaxID=110450 RepID=A0A6G1E5U9_9ORYZ|nr:hypothetical protein E2562_033451 [Oryza meyeriana var. granulata]
MDPDDHVTAAGEQGHQYHLTNATASEGGGGGGSWLCALFRRGWDLTQKVAIVGAVATAASVVAPPIILASASSLALSIPFAAYLANLAATDLLMAALLPSSPAKPAAHTHTTGKTTTMSNKSFSIRSKNLAKKTQCSTVAVQQTRARHGRKTRTYVIQT